MAEIFKTISTTYSTNPYLNGYAVPALFGSGVLGKAINGSLRIPALCASCLCTILAGELVLRGLEDILGRVGFIAKEKQSTWLTKQFFTTIGFDPRLFRANELTKKGEIGDEKVGRDTRSLIKALVKLTLFSIVATESVRILAGSPPKVYNLTALFGPIRVSGESYLEGVVNAIKALRAGA